MRSSPRAPMTGFLPELKLTVSAQTEQMALFPRRTTIEYFAPGLTAEALGEAEVDDGFRYKLKDDKLGQRVKANEWLGVKIGEEIGICSPSVSVIECQDGKLVFGSRLIANVVDEVRAGCILRGSLSAPQREQLCQILSRIYAYDMFINNPDRHDGNFIFVEDGGVNRAYAIDYAQGVFSDWPWIGFPSAGTHTCRYGKLLRQRHGFNLDAALEICDRLQALPTGFLQGVFNNMPPDWADQQIRSEFLGMWSGTGRRERLAALRQGLSDGTLL